MRIRGRYAGLSPWKAGNQFPVRTKNWGEEIRDQLGERPGVNRPVERHTGRLTPTARHELAGRLFVRWCLRTAAKDEAMDRQIESGQGLSSSSCPQQAEPANQPRKRMSRKVYTQSHPIHPQRRSWQFKNRRNLPRTGSQKRISAEVHPGIGRRSDF